MMIASPCHLPVNPASMSYCYEHPHPAVTVDTCLFLKTDDGLEVLLIRRAAAPFEGDWALPGGFVDIDEPLDEAAARELAEETGVSGVPLRQLYAFGAVDRDPRERVISIAYVGLVHDARPATGAGDDAADARWFPTTDLPSLAFDHAEILEKAIARVESKA